MFDVITIGAAIRDVFLVSDQFTMIRSPKFETGIGECVALGAKINVDTIVQTTGGGATNAAVTFARLGFTTAAVCRVGEDRAAEEIIWDLEGEGVDTSLIKRIKGGQTGYSTLLTAASGERSILTFRGVSAGFETKDVPLKECLGKCFYVTSLAGNLELAERIASQAVRCQALMAWNPGRAELAKGLAKVKSVLSAVNILLVNREEAQLVTKEKDLSGMFARLAAPGLVVIITDGEHGAHAAKDGNIWFAGTTGVKSLSRTGAGDAFGSGFVAEWMKTKDVKTSLAVGILNAESVIQHIGAKIGILRKWPSKKDLANIPVKTLASV